MPLEYVNRRGEKYFLLQGTTKTGKPKYYVSRKAEGVPVESVPEGYEIHENPERESSRSARCARRTSCRRSEGCPGQRNAGTSRNTVVM
jgi:hypothetical protein